MKVQLNPEKLTLIRERNPYLLSYNIEMTELMGGTFWTPYTDAQVEGTEEFQQRLHAGCLNDDGEGCYAVYSPMKPIDLYEPRIRTCAKALGPVIVRYSGSWATRAYYDLDGHTGGTVPEGFETVLTREQWQGALDFAKAAGAKIMVSLANCRGVHKDGKGEWLPDQAKALWDYTASQGMTIDYAEFMNQPDIFAESMLPEGYTFDTFARDHDLFADWLKENHPETTLVGPSCCMDIPRYAPFFPEPNHSSEWILGALKTCPPVFSCHSYTGASERLAGANPMHWNFSEVLSEKYLAATVDEDIAFYGNIRDRYVPNGEIWVTESADAYGGGNTWASSYVETIRLVDELCRFAAFTKGIIFHNTLACSAYGFLDVLTHEPRPQYWGGLLLNKLAGAAVYNTHEPIREGCHLYAFSRADGQEGSCYVYVNNSKTETAAVETPGCIRYTLSSDKLRSRDIFLNGQKLQMKDEYTLPELKGVSEAAGTIELAPATVSFLLV